MSAVKQRAIALVGTVDESELCCRMLEAAQGRSRPAGMAAAEAISHLDPDSRDWIRAQARAALQYMSECFANGVRPS